jgi:hypothetical protein
VWHLAHAMLVHWQRPRFTVQPPAVAVAVVAVAVAVAVELMVVAKAAARKRSSHHR